MTDKTCAERIDDHYDNVMETIRILWAGYCNDDCPECEGTGNNEEFRGGRTTCPSCGEGLLKEYETCPDCESEIFGECYVCKGKCQLEEDVEDYGSLHEYGLSFDYCYPEKNDAGYFRYQLSWGGPSDEFRIYANQVKYGWKVYRIEYWFMDWFDGASKTLHGEDFKFMAQLIESYFGDTESMTFEFNKAMENWEPALDEEDEDIDSESIED